VQVSIGAQIVQQHGDYPELRRAWVLAEELGADRIYDFDHFYPLRGDPDGKMLECWTLLGALAEVTESVEIGALVACNSYRNPNLHADMARTIDHVSGGRLIFGIGAGWFRRDYEEYGFEFGTPGTRLRQLARDLPVIKERFGKLNPPPLRQIPIMIGGGGEKVTLRIVAQHADIWHGFGDDETMRRKLGILDGYCAEIGRDPSAIERSASCNLAAGGDPDAMLALGVTHLVVSSAGPRYDLGPLGELIAWRDALEPS
jgi:probable F420-dependent oxidoreductase